MRTQKPEEVPHLPTVKGLLHATRCPHLVVGHDEKHARVPCIISGNHQTEQRWSERIIRRKDSRRIEIRDQDRSQVIVVITAEAEADLERIAAYVAEQSPQSALKLAANSATDASPWWIPLAATLWCRATSNSAFADGRLAIS